MSFLLKSVKAAPAPTRDVKDVKGGVGDREEVVLTMSRALKSALMGSKGKMRTLRTKVIIPYSNASAANTALATVTSLTLGSSAEYSSFAALFEEYYVHGGVVHWRATTNAATVAAPVTGVLVYDPEDTSALTSVFDGLSYQQVDGPKSLPGGASGLTTPASETASGFWKFPFRCPAGAQVNKNSGADAPNIATGLWCSTTDTGNAICGCFKPYFQAGGTSIVLTLTVYVVVDVSFRSRT